MKDKFLHGVISRWERLFRNNVGCVVFLFFVWWGSSSALAQNIDAKLFDPVSSPFALLNLHTSPTPGHLFLYGQLSTNYANDLLVGSRERVILTRPVAHRITSELGLTLGLLSWGEVGISLPVYLRQIGEDYPRSGEGRSATGVGDLRLLLKGRILQRERFGGLGLAGVAEVSFPTGSSDALMRNASVTFTPRLVLDFKTPCGVVIALNVAYRLRERAVIQGLVVADELRLSLGGEVPLYQRQLFLTAEAGTAIGLAQWEQEGAQASAAFNSPTEMLAGLRWRHDSGVQLIVGGGFGLTAGYGAPDFRVFLHLGYGGALLGPGRRERRSSVVLREPPPPRRHSQGPRPASPRRLPPLVRYRPPSAEAFARAIRNDPDADGDGIPRPHDRCPQKAEDFDKFQDEDGCPEADNDNDGIVDKKDRCPLRPETINGVDDNDGCPDKGASRVVLRGGKLLLIKEKVYFASGSDRLRRRSYPILRQVASLLKATSQVKKIRIDGHTDDVGDLEMNVDLSERRARRVREFLIKEGVSPQRLRAKGFGPKIPIASNKTRRGKAKNRRVEFTILQIPASKPPRPGDRR